MHDDDAGDGCDFMMRAEQRGDNGYDEMKWSGDRRKRILRNLRFTRMSDIDEMLRMTSNVKRDFVKRTKELATAEEEGEEEEEEEDEASFFWNSQKIQCGKSHRAGSLNILSSVENLGGHRLFLAARNARLDHNPPCFARLLMMISCALMCEGCAL